MSGVRKYEGWNPRFVKYCESIGKKPEEVNRDTTPGWTVGFMEWINQKIGKFAQVKPEAFYNGIYEKTLIDHKAFDEWLAAPVQEIAANAPRDDNATGGTT